MSESNTDPVDTEKEALKAQVAAEQAAANPPVRSGGTPSAVQADEDEAALPPPPAASFEMLISMLFTQAMATLGQIPDPSSGQAKVNKPYAKHYIDTLEMLGEKTDGNLTADEKKMHGEALHALRMAYVSTPA